MQSLKSEPGCGYMGYGRVGDVLGYINLFPSSKPDKLTDFND